MGGFPINYQEQPFPQIPKELLEQYMQRVKDKEEGPLDGVTLEVYGVRTKFRGHEEYRKIFQQNKGRLRLRASLSLGVVSITDVKNDFMLTIPIHVFAGFLNEALRVGMECMEKADAEGKKGGGENVPG